MPAILSHTRTAIYGCGCTHQEDQLRCPLHHLPPVRKERKCQTCGQWSARSHQECHEIRHTSTRDASLSHMQGQDDCGVLFSNLRKEVAEGGAS